MYKRKGNSYWKPLAHQNSIIWRHVENDAYEYSLILAPGEPWNINQTEWWGRNFLILHEQYLASTLGKSISRSLKSRKTIRKNIVSWNTKMTSPSFAKLARLWMLFLLFIFAGYMECLLAWVLLLLPLTLKHSGSWRAGPVGLQFSIAPLPFWNPQSVSWCLAGPQLGGYWLPWWSL